MQLMPALTRRLLNLHAAQALCARSGSGQRFELPCAIAQLQLLTTAASSTQDGRAARSSTFHTLLQPRCGAAVPGSRSLHTSSPFSVPGRGLEFRVSSGQGMITSDAGGDHRQQAGQEQAAQPELRQQLLDTALQYVKEHGWSDRALQAAAEQLQLSPAVTGMFERGPAELIEHFVRKCNNKFLAEARQQEAQLRLIRLPDRVAKLVRMRLELTSDFIESWPQAMGIQAAPANVGKALALHYSLMDDIWHLCGDKSTDLSWYTKRMLLSGVYSATELYMLTDYSPGLADTWQALDRRVQDVMRLGKLSEQARASAKDAVQRFKDLMHWFQSRTMPDDAQQGPSSEPLHRPWRG